MKFVLLLYNILIITLSLPAFAIGYFIASKKNGSAYFGERMGLIRLNHSPRQQSVWFHGASVGEVRSIKNIVDEIRTRNPNTSIIVSTITTTGRQEAVKYIKADETFLLPLENAAAIRHLIRLLGVKVFVVVDTEIWPNMITAAASLTPVVMINGRMSERTHKSYMKFRFLFSYILKKFTKIFLKSDADFNRFHKVIGKTDTLETIGNIKFQQRKNIDDIPKIKELEGLKVFLAASTHPTEEEFILSNINKLHNNFDKIVIAPRHINRSQEIKILAEKLGYTCSLYSQDGWQNTKVIIADVFGMLEIFYGASDTIFVGGSIAPIGGHNIYEALQFYKPVIVGENMQNFQELFILAKDYNIASSFTTPDEFNHLIATKQTVTKNSFDAFFQSIDEKNNQALSIIVSTIEEYLTSKRL